MLRSFRSVYLLALVFVILCFGQREIHSQGFIPTVHETLVLDAPDADYFGRDVALSGNTMLVGVSPYNEDIDQIYVYIRSGSQWIQQTKLLADDGDHFLSRIVLDGDTALVWAASDNDANDATVYVFVRNGTTWTKQAELMDDASSDAFGHGLAIQDNTAIILALESINQEDSRVVMYEFTRSGSTWTQTSRLSVGDYLPDTFGWLALDGNRALIGSSYNFTTPGNATVIVRNGNVWTPEAVLTPNDSEAGDFFGAGVALDGTTALVGAGGKRAAYVFEYDGSNWVQQQKIESPTPSTSSYEGFGWKVALEDNNAVISVPYSSPKGLAYTYTYDGNSWNPTKRLYTRGYSSDRWGQFLALDGGTAVLSHTNNSDGVYIFENVFASVVSQELLVNGGFDDSQTNGVPNAWTRKNTTKDERRCNKSNQPPVAHSGNCSYFMKGGETGGKLAQNVNLQNSLLQAGDVVRLNGFYNKQSTGSVYVYLYVSYANFPEDQRRIILTQPTNGYQPVNQSTITLKEAPTRIRVVLENQTTSGKTWFDGMNLIATTGSQNNLLSLPLPLDEQSQTESLIPLP